MLKIIAFIVYTALITFVSITPTAVVNMGDSDKFYHLVAYIIFAVLAAGIAKSKPGYAIICIGIVCYSGLLEVAQSFVPGRFMSAYDLLANAVGVAVGFLVMQRMISAGKPVTP